MTREEAVAMLRGLAFAECRTACYGDIIAGVVTRLENDAQFDHIRSDLRKKGMTPAECRFAEIEFCHQLNARLNSLGDWKTEIVDDTRSSPHVALDDIVAIFPTVKNGTGRMLRVAWVVQSLDIDDHDPEHATIKDAIIDAACRREFKRVSAALA